MPGADVLLTIAEVAVTFAGFASVVVLFQHRDPGRWPAAVVVRLRTMIESSLVTLFAALMPFLVYHGGLGAAAVWGVSSAVLAVVLAAFGALVWVRSRRAVAGGQLSGAFALGMAIVNAGVCLALVANAVGIGLGRNVGAYLVAVAWALTFAGLMFLRLVAFPTPADTDIS